MTFFDKLPSYPSDPIFGLGKEFEKDPREKKLSLVVGIYLTEKLFPEMFSSAILAKKRVLEKREKATYLPIAGDSLFIEETGKLTFGDFFTQNRSIFYGAQTVGGTGGLHIAAEVIKEHIGKKIYIPNPTWANHEPIFSHVGLKVSSYDYYKKHTLAFEKMCLALDKMEEGSVILLHGCCHNPTGCDPTLEQWEIIAEKIEKRKLLPLFDFAYQGFKDSPEKDREAIELFAKRGREMIVVTTYSKSFSLYSHRVGALFFQCNTPSIQKKVESVIEFFIRRNYSNPPYLGGSIVKEILLDEELKKRWNEDLFSVRKRINHVRSSLVSTMKQLDKDFSFLLSHHGLFSLLDLSSSEVEKLKEKWGVYLPKTGRVSFSGLNDENIPFFAKCLSSL